MRIDFVAKNRWAPEQIDPLEHLAQSAMDAVDDISAAICTAKTRGELGVLKTLCRTLIVQLDGAECTASTLDTMWDHMKGRS